MNRVRKFNTSILTLRMWCNSETRNLLFPPFKGLLRFASLTATGDAILSLARSHRRKLLAVSSRAVHRRQSVSDPLFLRCSPEPKVIGLQVHAPSLRLVQQHRHAQRTWFALAQSPQQKFLRHAAFQYCVHQQHVAPFQLRPHAKKNLAPRMPALFHVAHFFSYKMADRWARKLPHQIRRKNKSAIQRNHHVQPPALTRARNLPSQHRNPAGDSCGRKNCAQSGSSSITKPLRVFSLAAKSAAAGNPRAQTIMPLLVSTGQPSRSQRLIPFLFSSRFSL